MSQAQLWRGSGEVVRLGAVVGRGGEGEVRDVSGQPKLVAKIYLTRPADDRIDKLVAMVRVSEPAITKIAAWPVDTLHEQPGGAIVGFLMPKVGDRLELHKLSHPMDRFKHFPDVGYDFLVHVATNVARAFQVLHQHDLVIGDVNESGIMVGRDGTVMLIDTDSMQLRADGRLFTCDVGKPEFQPPELMARAHSFRGLVRKPEHDLFGLGVIVFQLLFFGWHPFNVKMLIGDQQPLADNIAHDRFPYALGFRPRDFVRPPHALDPAVLPDYVRDQLERAFVRGRERGTAAEWVAALMRLTSELTSCGRFGSHAYHRSLTRCPLCELDERLGFAILPHIALDAVQLRQIWAAVQAAFYELSTAVPEPIVDPTPLPPPPELERYAERRVLTTRVALGLAVVAVAGAFVTPWLALLLVVPAALELAQRVARPPLVRAVIAAQRRHEGALATARAALGGADSAVVLNFEEARQSYLRIIGFDDYRHRKIAELHDRAFPAQMLRHLARVKLEPGMVPGLGRKGVALLSDAGIRSAADLAHGVPAIEGVTESVRAMLERWVDHHKSRFIPDLTDPGLMNTIAQANLRYDAEYAQLIERVKLSAEWLLERVPRERQQRAEAARAYADAARALGGHAPKWRLVTARLRVPPRPWAVVPLDEQDLSPILHARRRR